MYVVVDGVLLLEYRLASWLEIEDGLSILEEDSIIVPALREVDSVPMLISPSV